MQGFNPILPSWEYIPDGEPHVFGDRVYLYGSHDRFNGSGYCLNDYVCYSAPVNDLKNWRYEGVIYTRADDPANPDGSAKMYAPDVACGADGRYYLYYVLNTKHIISVAVCDTPAGRYRFYGYVHHADGRILGEREGDEPHFDPGVLYEDGKCYLYTGHTSRLNPVSGGPMVTVLAPDMLTVAEEPRFIGPNAANCAGTGYEGHLFFEASSIRRVRDKYYFIYSSTLSHELCYAVSDSPVEGFAYGGTIISNADIGVDSYKPAEVQIAGIHNNHGSIECIDGQWYVFYHRHTNGIGFCRQACMEPIDILPDGRIPQVQITSCGSNGGPLAGEGVYPAYIACGLFSRGGRDGYIIPLDKALASYPFITQDGEDGDELPGYITRMDDGAQACFRFFACCGSMLAHITAKSTADGVFEVLTGIDGPVVGTVSMCKTGEWMELPCRIPLPDGSQSIFFRWRGKGMASLKEFGLKKNPECL